MVLIGLACSSGAATAPAGNSSWKLVWAGRFSGPAGSGVSTSDWTYETGRGIFGTGEVETMTSSRYNVRLDGRGDLDIIVLGHGAVGSTGAAWTSGRIRTRRQFAAPAGGELMVTASIRQPGPDRPFGYCPAFWMLGPGSWPGTGEIDIMEDVNGLSQASGTLHCGNLAQRNAGGTFGPCREKDGLGSGLRSCAGCQQGFHTYSVIIDRRDIGHEQIRWFLDGRQFFSVSESRIGRAAWTAAVDHGFSILLDVAVGGAFPDGQCRCITPGPQTSSRGTMVVRDLRVYTN